MQKCNPRGNDGFFLDREKEIPYNRLVLNGWIKSPGVAKLGIALGSGPRGRGFKSRHSDQKSPKPFGFGDFCFDRMWLSPRPLEAAQAAVKSAVSA